MSQKEQILNHCRKVKDRSISGYEALLMYRIQRLPARIGELEDDGFTFARETRFDASDRRYTRYTLASR